MNSQSSVEIREQSNDHHSLLPGSPSRRNFRKWRPVNKRLFPCVLSTVSFRAIGLYVAEMTITKSAM